MLVQRNIPALHAGLGEWAKKKLGEERFCHVTTNLFANGTTRATKTSEPTSTLGISILGFDAWC